MKKEVFDDNPILKPSFDFALMVVAYFELFDHHKKFVMSKQLLKSSTSIGAKAMETQNAETKADFIHKMKIAAKLAEESQYRLWLGSYAQNYQDCKS